MSQQKVDKYKEDKANRQKIVKKQKRVRRIEFIVIVAAIAAALVWFGVSLYNNNKTEQTAGVVYLDSKNVVDYMNDPAAYVESGRFDETGTEEEASEAADEAAEEGGDVEEVVIDETLDEEAE